MRQQNAGVGNQPAPVAGVMRTSPKINGQIEIHHAARTEKNRRAFWCHARAIGGDEHIGAQCIAMGCAKFVQAGRAGFLARFNQELDIEAKFAARFKHTFERTNVDGVLALVVCRAAAKKFFTFLNQRPRRESGAPLRVEPANHIAVTVRK